MAEINRNTVLGIVPEVTEGTPVAPSAATQYTALQDDFDIDPQFDTLSNAELKSSLGQGKPIIGGENPTASLSHYLRASGVEGQAPDYNDLLKSGFGSEVVASTQYNLVGSSTTSVLNVDAGEGVNFQRGQALLVKDGTNGYNIRPVQSVATDALTLGFNLAVAPALGVDLGKAILYKPADSAHQTLSLWAYRANRGAIEMISGARVTEIGMEFTAGELINTSFSLEGLKYHFNPITIAAADIHLDFLDNAATRVATVTAKVYQDPHELADAIASSMNSLGSANTFTCTYSNTTGKFTITSNGTTLSLLFNTGANTATTIANAIGFTVADETGALTYTSDTAMTLTSPYTPTVDSADPLVAKANEILIGDATDTTSISASSVSFNFGTERQVLNDVSATSGRSGSLIVGRTVTMSVTAYLTQYDADKFNRFREGTETRFLYNCGVKSGGNWVAGKCVSLYVPTAVISSFKVSNDSGILTLEMELTAFVDSSGNGEAYLNFV